MVLIPVDPIIRKAMTESARVVVNELPREVRFKIVVLLEHPVDHSTHTLTNLPTAEAIEFLRRHAQQLERPVDLAEKDVEGSA